MYSVINVLKDSVIRSLFLQSDCRNSNNNDDDDDEKKNNKTTTTTKRTEMVLTL